MLADLLKGWIAANEKHTPVVPVAMKPIAFRKRSNSNPPDFKTRKKAIEELRSPKHSIGSVIIRTDFKTTVVQNKYFELVHAKKSAQAQAQAQAQTKIIAFREPYPVKPKAKPKKKTPAVKKAARITAATAVRTPKPFLYHPPKPSSDFIRPPWFHTIPPYPTLNPYFTPLPPFANLSPPPPFPLPFIHPMLLQLGYPKPSVPQLGIVAPPLQIHYAPIPEYQLPIVSIEQHQKQDAIFKEIKVEVKDVQVQVQTVPVSALFPVTDPKPELVPESETRKRCMTIPMDGQSFFNGKRFKERSEPPAVSINNKVIKMEPLDDEDKLYLQL